MTFFSITLVIAICSTTDTLKYRCRRKLRGSKKDLKFRQESFLFSAFLVASVLALVGLHWGAYQVIRLDMNLFTLLMVWFCSAGVWSLVLLKDVFILVNEFKRFRPTPARVQ